MLTNLTTSFSTAATRAVTTREAIDDLVEQFGDVDAAVVLVFADARYDVGKMTALLEDRWPEAEIVACTTAGEFSSGRIGSDGITALAIPASRVKRARAELAGFRKGVESGVQGVLRRLERGLFCHLEDLDPDRTVGIVLFDGTHGDEEQFHRGLVRLAPMLTFIGASAADACEFDQTRISVNGRETDHGAAVVLMELDAPWTAFQTASVVPRSKAMIVTQVDVARRVVFEVDGCSLPHAYAESLGLAVQDLTPDVYARHPLASITDGDIWVRSPQELHAGGGLVFQGQIREGTALHVMDAVDPVADTAAAMAAARDRLGGRATGGLLFDDAYRQRMLATDGRLDAWRSILQDEAVAGFGGYGQSWRGHHNHTCTGILFG